MGNSIARELTNLNQKITEPIVRTKYNAEGDDYVRVDPSKQITMIVTSVIALFFFLFSLSFSIGNSTARIYFEKIN